MFYLTPRQAHEATECLRLFRPGLTHRPVHLLMGLAYEGNQTRKCSLDLGFILTVLSRKIRIDL